MTGESDDDLPLHDEAQARSRWRGDEPPLKGGGDSGPASEVDDSAEGSRQGGRSPEDDLVQRPPD